MKILMIKAHPRDESFCHALGDPGIKMMNANLRFCGIKPVRRSYFGSVKLSSQSTKDKWLKRAYQIGLNEK